MKNAAAVTKETNKQTSFRATKFLIFIKLRIILWQSGSGSI